MGSLQVAREEGKYDTEVVEHSLTGEAWERDMEEEHRQNLPTGKSLPGYSEVRIWPLAWPVLEEG